MFDDDDGDDDFTPPVPAHIGVLEAAVAAMLDAGNDRDAAGGAALKELDRLREAGDRDALFAMFRLVCLREDLQAMRRRPRRRVRR